MQGSSLRSPVGMRDCPNPDAIANNTGQLTDQKVFPTFHALNDINNQ